MGALRWLAKRRFNYIDGWVLGITGGLLALESYWLAGLVFVIGMLVSVAAEIVSE